MLLLYSVGGFVVINCWKFAKTMETLVTKTSRFFYLIKFNNCSFGGVDKQKQFFIMKKKYFLFTLISMCVLIQAKASEPVRFGAVAGMNTSFGYVGFHLGAKSEINLSKATDGLFIDTRALFEGINNIYFLNVPVHIAYKYNVNDDFAVFAGAGPELELELFSNYGKLGDTFALRVGLRGGIEIKNKYQISVGYGSRTYINYINFSTTSFSFAYMF